MLFDWKRKEFSLGPYVQVGCVRILRLWRWDLLGIGRMWRVVRHAEVQDA